MNAVGTVIFDSDEKYPEATDSQIPQFGGIFSDWECSSQHEGVGSTRAFSNSQRAVHGNQSASASNVKIVLKPRTP